MQYILSEEEYNRLKECEKYYNKRTLHIWYSRWFNAIHSTVGEEFDSEIKDIINRHKESITYLESKNLELEQEIDKLRDNLRKLCKKKWYQFVELKID